ncbi:hypothetical protein U1Q18_017728, partial [Sarracenia purpurea var. burkii]
AGHQLLRSKSDTTNEATSTKAVLARMRKSKSEKDNVNGSMAQRWLVEKRFSQFFVWGG